MCNLIIEIQKFYYKGKKMKNGFVYMLILEDYSEFKIGNSEDLFRRNNELSRDHIFNLKKSFAFEYENKEYIDVESILKRNFKKYKVHDKENSDGYTEFFYIHCLDDVLKFIELLNFNYISIVDVEAYILDAKKEKKKQENKKQKSKDNKQKEYCKRANKHIENNRHSFSITMKLLLKIFTFIANYQKYITFVDEKTITFKNLPRTVLEEDIPYSLKYANGLRLIHGVSWSDPDFREEINIDYNFIYMNNSHSNPNIDKYNRRLNYLINQYILSWNKTKELG